ncbi:MAG: hypothetical protein MZV49_13625 [Rhodopseudomonas palustris]|nr:hypothetical protein [Rhodopseudomonas palustris]
MAIMALTSGSSSLRDFEIDQPALFLDHAAVADQQFHPAQVAVVAAGLGDQHAVDHFGRVDAGMGVAADDDVELGHLLGQLQVLVVADVGQGEQDMAARRASSFISRALASGSREAQPLDLVGMGRGQAVAGFDLDQAEDGDA